VRTTRHPLSLNGDGEEASKSTSVSRAREIVERIPTGQKKTGRHRRRDLPTVAHEVISSGLRAGSRLRSAAPAMEPPTRGSGLGPLMLPARARAPAATSGSHPGWAHAARSVGQLRGLRPGASEEQDAGGPNPPRHGPLGGSSSLPKPRPCPESHRPSLTGPQGRFLLGSAMFRGTP
jgi:hypothetical protein